MFIEWTLSKERVKFKITVFWSVTLYIPADIHWYFTETYSLHLQGQRVSHANFTCCLLVLVSCMAYSTYKMEAVHSTEMSVDFYHATQHEHPIRFVFIVAAVRTSDATQTIKLFWCHFFLWHAKIADQICPYLKNWCNASETLPYHLYINYLNVVPNKCVVLVRTMILYWRMGYNEITKKLKIMFMIVWF
jgi:hypothetical protein